MDYRELHPTAVLYRACDPLTQLCTVPAPHRISESIFRVCKQRTTSRRQRPSTSTPAVSRARLLPTVNVSTTPSTQDFTSSICSQISGSAGAFFAASLAALAPSMASVWYFLNLYVSTTNPTSSRRRVVENEPSLFLHPNSPKPFGIPSPWHPHFRAAHRSTSSTRSCCCRIQ